MSPQIEQKSGAGRARVPVPPTLINLPWQLIPKPLLSAAVLLVVIFLLVVHIAAIIYTPLHYSCMSYPYQWKYVRDWMCSSWDNVQCYQGECVMSDRSIGAPLENILSNEMSLIVYGLPHQLVRLETMVRSYRAELPESKYSSYDQVYFHSLFTAYIEQSQNTTHDSHRFYHHMKGTIRKYIFRDQIACRVSR